eukprot:scaffold6.g2910.t1
MVTTRSAALEQPGFFARHSNVFLYVPNLIGYARIACAFYAFAVALRSPGQTALFYFLSFVCDELDGRFARLLGQTSKLGAVLDMVTDRLATTCLLADVASSSLVVRFYYRHRLFMGFCCVCCEVLYLCLYLLSWPQYQSWAPLPLPAALRPLANGHGAATGSLPAVAALALVALPGVAVKQLVNVVQLRTAAGQLAALNAAQPRPKHR